MAARTEGIFLPGHVWPCGKHGSLLSVFRVESDVQGCHSPDSHALSVWKLSNPGNGKSASSRSATVTTDFPPTRTPPQVFPLPMRDVSGSFRRDMAPEINRDRSPVRYRTRGIPFRVRVENTTSPVAHPGQAVHIRINNLEYRGQPPECDTREAHSSLPPPPTPFRSSRNG